MAALPGYTFRQKITIDADTYIDGDLSDLPIVINIPSSNADFWSNEDGAGGTVRFTASDGSTLLKFQEESFDAIGEDAWFHVKIPTLSSSADTDIYVYYNTDTPSDGSDKENVWDSNFKAVYHLNQDQSEGAFDDATSNNANLVNNGTTDRLGQIDRARDCDGSNDYLDGGDIAGFKFGTTGDFTVEAIIEFDVMADVRIISNKRTSGDIDQWGLQSVPANNALEFVVFKSGYTFRAESTNGSIVTGTKYHVVGTRTSNGTTGTIYFDAIQEGTDSGTAKNVDLADNFNIGRDPQNLGYFNGMQDEVTISDVARSLDWIKARNQSRLGTWLSFSAEESFLEGTKDGVPTVIHRPPTGSKIIHRK